MSVVSVQAQHEKSIIAVRSCLPIIKRVKKIDACVLHVACTRNGMKKAYNTIMTVEMECNVNFFWLLLYKILKLHVHLYNVEHTKLKVHKTCLLA